LIIDERRIHPEK